MSYNISFRVKVDGLDRWLDVGPCDANITWNVRKIIEKSTGLPWVNGANNGLCRDVIPCIQKGLHELLVYGYKYKEYEASNGWGTVEGTIGFFRRILDCWDRLIADDEQLAQIATFWID